MSKNPSRKVPSKFTSNTVPSDHVVLAKGKFTRNNRTGTRSVVKKITRASRSVIPRCLKDAYDDDDDENDDSEDKLMEKRIRENFLSQHDAVLSNDGNITFWVE